MLLAELYEHCLSTYLHSMRVGDELHRFATFLNLDDSKNIYLLGSLHDIGKLKIPYELLNKRGPITREEYKQIQLHTEYGERILQSLQGEIPHDYPLIVKFHHEDFNGKGYYGLQGNEIPLLSRMIRIVDSYDTMLYGRIYQKHRNQHEVLNEICSLSGKQFDPEIVLYFKQYLSTRFNIESNYGT